MVRRSLYVLLILLLTTLPVFAQTGPVVVSGIVFEDTNGNGIKDRKEKCISSIPVSDGETIVLTDKKGEYKLQTTVGCSVFSITPRDLTYSGASGNANSKLLYIVDSIPAQYRHDIALIKRKSVDDFRIAAVGDIQANDMEELGYAGKTVFAELAGRNDIDFNIFLGDQVNDNTALFADVGQMMEALPMPSWSVLGNHDRNYDKNTPQNKDFNLHFGASHYAFNYGNVHFIILNNVYSENGERRYNGFVSDRQLRFIENDLQHVPLNKMIVLCQHIPMSQTANRDEVFKLFVNRASVLILSGHTHQVGRHIFSPSIQEITAGAACGSWWLGERDIWGIPTAMMQCGSPKGYFIITFSKDDYSFKYKGAGLDGNVQMSISCPENQIANTGAEINHIIANIYGASDRTVVKMSVDGGEWMDMKRTEMVAPSVSRMIMLNGEGVYPTKYSRRIPFRKRNSPHIWTAPAPCELTKGLHFVKIAASDDYGFSTDGYTYIYF